MASTETKATTSAEVAQQMDHVKSRLTALSADVAALEQQREAAEDAIAQLLIEREMHGTDNAAELAEAKARLVGINDAIVGKTETHRSLTRAVPTLEQQHRAARRAEIDAIRRQALADFDAAWAEAEGHYRAFLEARARCVAAHEVDFLAVRDPVMLQPGSVPAPMMVRADPPSYDGGSFANLDPRLRG